MYKYLLKRILLMLLTIITIIIVVFFLLRLMKGYPAAIQDKLSGVKEKWEIKAILDSYNPEPNAFIAFGNYVKNLFQGDFGIYYADASKTIPEIFLGPLKYTLLVTAPSFFIGTTFGIICGFVSGYKRGKWQDITVNVVATLFVSIPSFVLAMFLLLFGNKIGLPTSFVEAKSLGKGPWALIIPITIVSITSFSTLTYYIRNEVVEVLSSDYVAIARAKGLSEKQVFFKHILRNVSLPFIAIVFPSFLTIMFGSFIIEIFFGIPGSSHVFALAVRNNERDVVMFSTIFFTSFGLLIHISVDILYVIFDPRITLGSADHGFSMKKRFHGLMMRRKELKHE